MKKTTIIALVALIFIGIAAMGVYAFPFNGNKENNKFGNSEINAALKAGDYDAYVTALSGTYVAPMDEDHFNSLVLRFQKQAVKAAQDDEVKSKIEAAIEAKDYGTWYELQSGLNNQSVLLEKITKDNFDTYAKLYEAMQNVRELSDELGLNSAEIGGFGVGRRNGPGFMH